MSYQMVVKCNESHHLSMLSAGQLGDASALHGALGQSQDLRPAAQCQQVATVSHCMDAPPQQPQVPILAAHALTDHTAGDRRSVVLPI